MDRSIPLLLIGLVFGGGIGFTVAAANGITLDGHDHGDPAHHGSAAAHHTAHDAAHAHGAPLALPSGPGAPSVALKAVKDPAAGWNLHIAAENFRYAPERASLEHAHGPGAPSVALKAVKDPAAGWNLHIAAENFRYAPERASLEHVPGEGHAHVYVNGEKLGRVYGPWLHLGSLPEGEVELKVSLNSNDHRPLAVDGALVEARTVIQN
ncbi:hypothetical protein ACUXV3_17945 [Roseobacteraceae bacterium NS-SX3]